MVQGDTHSDSGEDKYPRNILRKQISAFSKTESVHEEEETASDEVLGQGQQRQRTGQAKKLKKYGRKHSNGFTDNSKNQAEVAFLSKQVRMDLLTAKGLPAAPSFQEQVGVVLFVDISGFTALGKKLRTDFTPTTATELLAAAIFGALECLTGICLQWGGDVAKFAGDALLCTWRVDDLVPGASKSVEQALRQARRAAFEMIQALSTDEFKDLDIHGGIGAGDYLSCHLEDEAKVAMNSSRWHLIAGKACLVANTLLEKSRKGEILFYEDFTESDEIGRITAATKIIKNPQFMQDLDGFDAPLNVAGWSERLNFEEVKLYVPVGLRNKLHGGGLEGGEVHQRISVMFVAVDYLQMSEDELEENSLDKRKLLHLNNVYKSFTRIVHEYGGEIRDLLFDDKGCVFIAVFGAHNVIELPELKCMRAAIKMSSTHNRVKIGVDVGKCFTGMCGTKERHDFVVMGHEVNMASRYMSGAEIGQVIASPKIKKATMEFVKYKPLVMPFYKTKPIENQDGTTDAEVVKVSEYECFIAAKKLVERAPSFIATFRANQQHGSSVASLDSTYSAKLDKTFVGRDFELNTVFDFISDNNRKQTHGVITVTGVEGIGKSIFVKQVRNAVNRVDWSALGASFALEQNTPYFVVRQVVSDLIGLERGRREENQEKIVAKLKEIGMRYDASALSHLFPDKEKKQRESIVRIQSLLAKTIERSDLAVDDPIDKQIRAVSRRQSRSIKKVVKRLISQRQKNSNKGLLIVVEDLQWIDPYSLELLEEMCQEEFSRVTFLFTLRPLSQIEAARRGKVSQFLTNIETVDNLLNFTIDALTEEESNELVRGVLEMETSTKRRDSAHRRSEMRGSYVDSAVNSLVFERTNGHPNHIVILVKWFVESRNVVYTPETTTFKFPNEASMQQSRLKLPGNLRELILSRLDFSTDGDTRRILKVAAVIGHHFKEGLLHKVLKKDGFAISEDELRASLIGLQDLGFIVLGTDVDDQVPKDDKDRANSYTSVSSTLAPRLKNKVRRYLNQDTDEWNFTAEVIQQAIKSLIPQKRFQEIEEIIYNLKRSRMGKLKHQGKNNRSFAKLRRFFS